MVDVAVSATGGADRVDKPAGVDGPADTAAGETDTVFSSGPSVVQPGGTDARRSGSVTELRSPRTDGGAAASSASRACAQSAYRRRGSGSAIRRSTAASWVGTPSGRGSVWFQSAGMSGDELL